MISNKILNVSSHLFGNTLLERMLSDSRTRPTSRKGKLRKAPPRLYSKLSPKPCLVNFISLNKIDGNISERSVLSNLFKDTEAHRLLETEGRAPRIFYCSMAEDPHTSDLAGLIMVVMRYINEKPAHQLRPVWEAQIISLNDACNTTNIINWHPDVERDGKMTIRMNNVIHML